jgi:hypothetical protein
MIKGVIFAVENVIAPMEASKERLLGNPSFLELLQLFRFLQLRGVTPTVMTNRPWNFKKGGGSLKAFLEDQLGFDVNWFSVTSGMPSKPYAASLRWVRGQLGLEAREVVYVGSTTSDMRTAVNGQVLFLNAHWFKKVSYYGFDFTSPKDLGRFIDLFCFRDRAWFFDVEAEGLRVLSLAPYSTRIEGYERYTRDAQAALKRMGTGGHPEFWLRYLITSLYLSGLYERVDYVVTYPGHSPDSSPSVLSHDDLDTFAKCFRINHLKDLLVRHRTATKSSYARGRGQVLDHSNQLNTVKLRRDPMRTNGSRFRNNPIKPGKTVLVIDDICTEGNSLDTARALIQKLGADVLLVSCLKTINRGYDQLDDEKLGNFNPFEENSFSSEQIQVKASFDYSTYICDQMAPEDLLEKLKTYDEWEWPT